MQKGNSYVDKTTLIYELINRRLYYFLLHPRMFSKSLLTSTVKAAFENKLELFKGVTLTILILIGLHILYCI